MTKRRIMAAILLLAFAFAAGCTGDPAQPPAAESSPAAADRPPVSPTPETARPEATAPVTPTPETGAPVPADPVQERLDAMTVEEKAAQLLVAGIEGTEPGADAVSAIQEYHVGGVILFGRNVESAAQLAELNSGLRALNDGYIPLFLCVDEEGGRVSRMPPEVAPLPAAYEYGKTMDGDLCNRLGETLAAECRAFGFNVDFAPSLDIWSNPDNTVIGDRAFGNDKTTVSLMGPRVAYGLMSGGVIPVVKHFPGHGDTAVDSHVGLPVVGKTVDELMENELKPFRYAMGEDPGAGRSVPAVMVAHILMTQLDPDRPASLSHAVVTGLLREKLGFQGMVCTDDLTMAAVSDVYGMGETAVMAVEAGCDLLLVCHRQENLEAAYQGLMDAVNSGRITMERLDESVYRILAVKEEYGLTNDPVEPPDVEALNEIIRAAQP